MGTEPAEETRELTVAVVGMGQWVLETYAKALAQFAQAWFLRSLTVWFFDPEPRGQVALANGRRIVVKLQEISEVFQVTFQQEPVPLRWWTGQRGGLTVRVVEGTGPRSANPVQPLFGSVPDEAWCHQHLNDVQVVFVVCPPEDHIAAVRGWRALRSKRKPVVIVEKPFCLTKEGVIAHCRAGALPLRNRPYRPSWYEWCRWCRTVFGFDHYLTRLWFLIYYSARLGPVKRVIFRLREQVDNLAAIWPNANPRWRYGAVQDLGAHAAPLLLLFGDPPRRFQYSVAEWYDANGNVLHNPGVHLQPYFHFVQPGWRDEASLFTVDIGIGWYDPQCNVHPDQCLGDPDKFLLVEFEHGWLWADLAQPFQVFDHAGPMPQLTFAQLYFKRPGPGAQLVLGSSEAAPVDFMIRAVLTSTLKGVRYPRVAVMPLETHVPPRISVRRVMRILDAWDERYRS